MIEKKYRWDAIKARMTPNKSLYGVEVGVWRGQMSARLLEAMPELYLIMVDWWSTPPEGHSYFNGSLKIAKMSQEEMDKAYNEAKERVSPYSDRCKIIKQESVEASKRFFDGTFDFVFIDGDHSYNGVMRDLEAWVRKVCCGGYICGHDYDHPQQGQVKQAVHNFFKGREQDIEIDVNRTWFVKI